MRIAWRISAMTSEKSGSLLRGRLGESMEVSPLRKWWIYSFEDDGESLDGEIEVDP